METDNHRALKSGLIAWAVGIAILGVVAVPESLLTWRLRRVPNQGPLSSMDAILAPIAGSTDGAQRVETLIKRVPKSHRIWIIQTNKAAASSESALALSIMSWPLPAPIFEWPISPSKTEGQAPPDSAFVVGSLDNVKVPSLPIGHELAFIPRMQP